MVGRGVQMFVVGVLRVGKESEEGLSCSMHDGWTVVG